jgi:hypothetical protein
MEKAALNKNETLFTGILDFKLKGATSTGNMAMYGVETWTLEKLDQKYLGSFEMWCGEGWRPILVDRSCKKWQIYHGVKEDRNILCEIKWRKADRIGHILRRNCFLKHVIEGNREGISDGGGEEEVDS